MHNEFRDGLLLPLGHENGDETLCIRWVNTVSWRGRTAPTEELTDPDAWVGWLLESGTIADSEARALRETRSAAAADVEAAFMEALEARECTYRVLASQAAGQDPEDRDQERFELWTTEGLGRLTLSRAGGAWHIERAPSIGAWGELIGPCVLSAVRLLLSPSASRIRLCARPECAWMFLDSTKNRSRKWCDMSSCGNVVKARRSYARKKEQKEL